MKVLIILFHFLSFIYPYKLHRMFHSVRDFFYSLWIRNFIGKVGIHSKICHPCSLQGGGQKNISIGEHTIINSSTILGCWVKYEQQDFPNASITIGNHCNIGEYNHITASNKITIGDGLLTGRYVIISDNSHGGLSKEESLIRPMLRNLQSKGEVVIGNNVWLGDKVAVLSGVHIGNNVIVGANSVVTKSIPDNCMVAGVPAQIIKRI